jgi:hypothetical protein
MPISVPRPEVGDYAPYYGDGYIALILALGEAWRRRGTANNRPVTATALLYIIAGHVEHHRAILAERYGVR